MRWGATSEVGWDGGSRQTHDDARTLSCAGVTMHCSHRNRCEAKVHNNSAWAAAKTTTDNRQQNRTQNTEEPAPRLQGFKREKERPSRGEMRSFRVAPLPWPCTRCRGRQARAGRRHASALATHQAITAPPARLAMACVRSFPPARSARAPTPRCNSANPVVFARMLTQPGFFCPKTAVFLQ